MKTIEGYIADSTRIKLLKPYSIWSQQLQKDCIAVFHWESGMWREFKGGMVGMSRSDMNMLLQNKYAVITTP